jgi:hypothetical protein
VFSPFFYFDSKLTPHSILNFSIFSWSTECASSNTEKIKRKEEENEKKKGEKES